MKTLENMLDYETYYALRESVGWRNICREQAEKSIKNSYYSVVLQENRINIAMGRVIGDGMYFTIVDIVVRPEYQGQGIGTMIIQRILRYIEEKMPIGGRASIQLISEIGKEDFYIKQGFKLIPHEYCGSALRKVIHK